MDEFSKETEKMTHTIWHKIFYITFLILSFAAVVFVSTPSYSAMISVENDNTIYIRGDILEGDGEAFQKTLKLHPEASIVNIISIGGVVNEGLIIAEEIYNRGMTTYIPKDGVCYSMCSFIFLSGKEKIMHLGQRLGFHPPYIIEDGKNIVHTDTVAHISWWLGRVGIPLEVIWAMMAVSPDDVYKVDGIDLNNVGIGIILLN